MSTIPLTGTNIRFLSGVPFSNDYKHSRWFLNENQQKTYFQTRTLVHEMQQANYQKVDGRYFVNVNLHLDRLHQTNYFMFQNSDYANKWFYCFVTKMEYIQKNTTRLYFEIDVLQSWMFDFTFKPSYVVREHCKLWNSDGSPVINTVDEGLNYGLEYDTVYGGRYEVNNGYKWLVIISKTPLHLTENEIEPTQLAVTQPLSYYIVPFKGEKVPQVQFIKNNLPSSNISITYPPYILKKLYKNEKATNNIVSLYVSENLGLQVTTENLGSQDLLKINIDNHELQSVNVGEPENPLNLIYVKKIGEFHSSVETWHTDKYQYYKPVKESKLLMYPYTVLTLDNFRGSRVDYKNEYINSNELRITSKGSLGTSNKNSYGIEKYNSDSSMANANYTNQEYALIDNTPNDIPIITDMLSAYLQGNRNSLQVEKGRTLFNGAMNFGRDVFNATAKAATGVGAVLAIGDTFNIAQGMGNTVIDMMAFQAKQNDIANTPPSINKMGGNITYDFGNGYHGLWIIKKQIKQEYIDILTEFFNMCGYKVNRIKMPNLYTRENWNYIQTLSCNITGDFNHETLNKLKSVFDGGITLWHTNDIGNYFLSNEVIA